MVVFEGIVSRAEVLRLIELYEIHRDWLGHDSIYILHADQVDVGPVEMDLARRRIFDLYQNTELLVLRRSAWIFTSPHTRRLVEYWLTGRHARDGSAAEFCLGRTLDDARELFTEQELEAVRAGAGFKEAARIEVTN